MKTLTLKKPLLSFALALGIIALGGIGFTFFHKKKPSKATTPPQLTMVFVIDQFAYHYLYKIRPFLTGGLKTLLDKGTLFTHATHPHGVPSTACGHAAIGCGAYAKHHGIIGNEWIGENGDIIESTFDTPEHAAMFKPNGDVYTDKGASSKQLMVDNLSDSFALTAAGPQTKKMVFSFAFKDRAAIMMGGKMGKSFWFDEKGNGLTSSKAYFDKLPAWLIDYNKHNAPVFGKEMQWKPIHKLNSPAYDFAQKDNYAHCAMGPLFNKSFSLKNPGVGSNDDPYEMFDKTPHADAFVVGAVKECLTQNFTAKPDESCLLWLSFSCLDLAGHYYGPHSVEALDMVYQIDQRIQELLDFVEEKYPGVIPLVALTADHGVMPIPEVLNDEGFKLPMRIDAKKLVDELNTIAHVEYGIEKIIKLTKSPQFFFDKRALKKLAKPARKALTERLANVMREKPYIKRVWTHYDTAQMESQTDFYTELFFNQHYKGRSPHLTCLTAPYHMLTTHKKGTSHDTPYLYDVHVPLVLWHKGFIEHKTITDPVRILQLPMTLAHILNVQCPSADERDPLPEVLKNYSKKKSKKAKDKSK